MLLNSCYQLTFCYKLQRSGIVGGNKMYFTTLGHSSQNPTYTKQRKTTKHWQLKTKQRKHLELGNLNVLNSLTLYLAPSFAQFSTTQKNKLIPNLQQHLNSKIILRRTPLHKSCLSEWLYDKIEVSLQHQDNNSEYPFS